MTRGVPLGMTPAERKQHLAPQRQRPTGKGWLVLLVLVAWLVLLVLLCT